MAIYKCGNLDIALDHVRTDGMRIYYNHSVHLGSVLIDGNDEGDFSTYISVSEFDAVNDLLDFILYDREDLQEHIIYAEENEENDHLYYVEYVSE